MDRDVGVNRGQGKMWSDSCKVVQVVQWSHSGTVVQVLQVWSHSGKVWGRRPEEEMADVSVISL